MDEQTASQTDEKPTISFELDSEEVKPELIICANDDNFEIAFDPFATINDADQVHSVEIVEPITVGVESSVQTDKRKIKREIVEPNIEDKSGIPLEDSSADEAIDDFYWEDEGTSTIDQSEELPFEQIEKAAESIKDEDRFKCSECGQSFKSLSLLKGHAIAKKHSTNIIFTCLICDRKFRRSNNLKVHMEAVHPIDENGEAQSAPPPKKCPHCNKLFSHGGNFKTHIRIHQGIRAFPCTICDKAFKLAQHLKSHIKLVHSGEKSIQCTICGRLFNHPGNFRKHLRTHSGDRPFQCKICNKSFGQSSNYTAHQRVHMDEKPFKCTECDRSFIQKLNLTNHMRTAHSNAEQLKCTECDQTFMRINQLRLHEKKHHRPEADDTQNVSKSKRGQCRPQLCSICGKSLAGGRRSLRMHMKIHDNIRPHNCAYCDKRFITKSDCSKHERLHTGEMPYECTLCSRRFRHSASFRIHMRNHSGLKPYQCTHCDKKFSASSDCKKHMKSHENGRLAAAATVATATILSSEEIEKTDVLYLL